jgi:hypothetical protein
MSKEKVSAMSWASKVLAKLNLSEEGKVGLFGDTLVKDWTKQIRDKKKYIAQLETDMEDMLLEANEKLEDFKEEYEEAFLNVNVNRISTSDARHEYVEDFTDNLVSKKNKVLGQIQKIKDIEESYKENIKEVQEQIDLLEEFKKNI